MLFTFLLRAEEVSHAPTMGDSPIFQQLYKQAEEMSTEIIRNEPNTCKVVKAVSGRSAEFIRDHYLGLAKDFVNLVPRENDTNFGGVEIYTYASGFTTEENLKKIREKFPQALAYLQAQKYGTVSWTEYVKLMGGDEKLAMLSLLLTEEFVRSTVAADRDVMKSPELKQHKTFLASGEYAELWGLQEKYIASAKELAKQNKISSDVVEGAEYLLRAEDDMLITAETLDANILPGQLTAIEIARYKELRSQLSAQMIKFNKFMTEALDNAEKKYGIFDSTGKVVNSSHEIFDKLGLATRGKSYKLSGGITFAWALREKGYSPTDLLYVVRQGSLAYEATDILYDHFGKKSEEIDTVVENDAHKGDSALYDKFLAQLRVDLKSNDALAKALTANLVGIPQLQKLMPQMGLELFDHEYYLTLALVSTLKNDRKTFQQQVLPIMQRSMGADAAKRTDELFQNSVEDVELTEAGVTFFLENSKNIPMPQANAKWEGILTPQNTQLLNKACNATDYLRSATGTLDELKKRVLNFFD